MTPLRIAIWQREREDRAVVPGQLISRSDAGSQPVHLAEVHRAPCSRPSASSLPRSFTTGPYKTVSDVEYAAAGWVDWWNNRRLHGTGMITPNEVEQAHYAVLIPQEQPVWERHET